MAEVTFDIMGEEKVARRIGELAGEFGVSIRFLCMEQMKLFARDVIKKTGGDPRSTLAAQKRAGKGAIVKDLNNIFIPQNKLDGQLEPMRDSDGEGLGYVLNFRSGGIMAIRPEQDMRSASMQAIGKIHRDNRGRNGRVKRPRSTRYRGLTNPETYVVKTATFNAYKKELFSHIFTIKAGWVRALEMLEQKTGGKPVSGVPAALRQLKSRAPQSGLIDNRSEKNVMLRADNRVGYAGRVIKQSDVDAIGRTREKDLFGSAKKRMDQVVERYNKTKG